MLGHVRIRRETGARLWLLVLAELTTVVVLVSFVATSLVGEPATTVALLVILGVSLVLDLSWKARRPSGPSPGAT